MKIGFYNNAAKSTCNKVQTTFEKSDVTAIKMSKICYVEVTILSLANDILAKKITRTYA
ncbi:hypothetical protein AJO04nite_03340 [Acinetobacter johnsonii]|uniref:Uncharacterized protein n=1 Tax=Acinetobacter johnsonii TaxID=40214 RepID=A0AAV3W986_ACIJO|nr:hypothetical protein AJO04nite_03340 [Acinetobacter johnsonii]